MQNFSDQTNEEKFFDLIAEAWFNIIIDLEAEIPGLEPDKAEKPATSDHLKKAV